MKLNASTKVRVIVKDVCVQPLTVQQAETVFTGIQQMAVQFVLQQIVLKKDCRGMATNYGGVNVQVDVLDE